MIIVKIVRNANSFVAIGGKDMDILEMMQIISKVMVDLEDFDFDRMIDIAKTDHKFHSCSVEMFESMKKAVDIYYDRNI